MWEGFCFTQTLDNVRSINPFHFIELVYVVNSDFDRSRIQIFKDVVRATGGISWTLFAEVISSPVKCHDKAKTQEENDD
ncbi:hypothetical protein OROGR_008197 [Orobanche gracilis]